MPTTFMKLAQFQQVTVNATGEATRRMVDLSLVLDVSSSIGSKWAAVRDATRTFINSFDGAHDRVALLTFGNGASVLDAMPAGRGFDKTKVWNDVPVDAARRQHEHGRRAVSRMGRAALGAHRQAVESSRHRAVHRRRVQQRAWQLRRGARTGTCAENVGLPETAAIRTARRTTLRISTASIRPTAPTVQAAPVWPRCRRTGTTRAPSRRRNRVASRRYRICR